MAAASSGGTVFLFDRVCSAAGAAGIRAKTHLIPVARPFSTPGEGAVAGLADFLREIGFGDHGWLARAMVPVMAPVRGLIRMILPPWGVLMPTARRLLVAVTLLMVLPVGAGRRV